MHCVAKRSEIIQIRTLLYCAKHLGKQFLFCTEFSFRFLFYVFCIIDLVSVIFPMKNINVAQSCVRCYTKNTFQTKNHNEGWKIFLS